MAKISIREWREKFNAGDFDSADVGVQIGAGWYDWFCDDSQLPKKLAEMAKPILRIKDGGKVDLDGSYLMFKNNCPLAGELYDDFRICSLETGEVLFCCTMDEPDERYSGELMKWHAHAMDKRYARPYEDAWGFRSMTSLASWLSKPWDGPGSDIVDGWLEMVSDHAVLESEVVNALEHYVAQEHLDVHTDPIVEMRGVQTREMAMFYMQNTLSYLLPEGDRMNAVAFPMDGGALVCFATERLATKK